MHACKAYPFFLFINLKILRNNLGSEKECEMGPFAIHLLFFMTDSPAKRTGKRAVRERVFGSLFYFVILGMTNLDSQREAKEATKKKKKRNE